MSCLHADCRDHIELSFRFNLVALQCIICGATLVLDRGVYREVAAIDDRSIVNVGGDDRGASSIIFPTGSIGIKFAGDTRWTEF